MSFPPPPGQHDPYPQHPYAFPPPYGEPPQYGYPPPYPGGYPQPGRARVSQPLTGWLLLAAAALTIIGSVTPWAHLHIFGQSIDVAGTDASDGKITIVFGVIFGACGLVIALRQGRLWASIVGVVFASLTVVIGLADVGSITRLYGPAKGLDLPDDAITTSFGLWFVVVGGAAAIAFSIAAMVRRTALGPSH